MRPRPHLLSPGGPGTDDFQSCNAARLCCDIGRNSLQGTIRTPYFQTLFFGGGRGGSCFFPLIPMTGSRDFFPLGKSPALWAGKRKAQFYPQHEGDRTVCLRYVSRGATGRRLGGEKPVAQVSAGDLSRTPELRGHAAHLGKKSSCPVLRGHLQIDHVHFQSLKFSQPSG